MCRVSYVIAGDESELNGQEVPGGRRNGNKLSNLELGPRKWI